MKCPHCKEELNDKLFLSAKSLAEVLDLPLDRNGKPHAVYHYRDEGMPIHTLGWRIRFNLAECLTWLEARGEVMRMKKKALPKANGSYHHIEAEKWNQRGWSNELQTTPG